MSWKAVINEPVPGANLEVTVTCPKGYARDGEATMDDGERFFLLFYKEDPTADGGIHIWTMESTAKEEGHEHLMSAIVVAGKEIKAHDRRRVINGPH